MAPAERLAGLRADVGALAAMERGSAGPGERACAAWIADRLREAGVEDVAVEPYRGQTTYAWAYLAHLGLGALAARRRSLPVALALLAALEGEVSGRRPLLRRALPRREGANVVARIPAAGGGSAGRTLVLVAHHDTARTGLVWDPRLARAMASRRLAKQEMDPFVLPFAPFLVLATLRRTRVLGLAGLAAAAALALDVARHAAVPGASDNGTGVAALLALAASYAAESLPGTEVLLVFPGGEEAGMDGMRAFLAAHPLDPARTLVLGLDTLGAGVPIVAAAEGGLLRHDYRARDLAHVPPEVERWRLGGWTDPILARFAGLPTVSLLSRGPEGGFTNYHLPSDTPDRVDWDSVAACLDAAERTVAHWRGEE